MTATDTRWFTRDHKPYALPETLEELRGPDHGIVELPHSIFWAPGDRKMNLETPHGFFRTYVAALAEGTLDDIRALVNADRLVQMWGELLLPRRVETMWEERFPQLKTGASQ